MPIQAHEDHQSAIQLFASPEDGWIPFPFILILLILIPLMIFMLKTLWIKVEHAPLKIENEHRISPEKRISAVTLYVQGPVNEEQAKEIFEQFGKINEIRCRREGQFSPLFIEFSNQDSAAEALVLDNTILNGTTIRASFASEKGCTPQFLLKSDEILPEDNHGRIDFKENSC